MTSPKGVSSMKRLRDIRGDSGVGRGRVGEGHTVPIATGGSCSTGLGKPFADLIPVLGEWTRNASAYWSTRPTVVEQVAYHPPDSQSSRTTPRTPTPGAWESAFLSGYLREGRSDGAWEKDDRAMTKDATPCPPSEPEAETGARNPDLSSGEMWAVAFLVAFYRRRMHCQGLERAEGPLSAIIAKLEGEAVLGNGSRFHDLAEAYLPRDPGEQEAFIKLLKERDGLEKRLLGEEYL